MDLDTIDLIVRDVRAAGAFFRDALGLEVQSDGDRFAEVQMGRTRVMLSPDAMVPTALAAGVILHLRVEDVAESVNRARAFGATVLREPANTDWGWESGMIAGPEGVVIDLYRPVPLS